jgi:GxxExxY protein
MEPQNTQSTQMDTDGNGVNPLSRRIIGCALTVLAVSQQHSTVVQYDGIVVGQYAVDLLVEHTVLVELKVTRAIDEIHRAQCLNYLKATGLHLCLLLNFGRPRLEIKRIVLDL